MAQNHIVLTRGIRATLINEAFRQGRGGVPMTALAVLGLTTIHEIIAGEVLQPLWLSSMILVLLLRTSAQIYHALYRNHLSLKLQERLFVWPLHVTSLLWALLPPLVFPKAGSTEILALVTICAAMAGGAATTLAPLAWPARVYLACMLLPSSIMLYQIPKSGPVLSMLGVFFLLIMLVGHKQARRVHVSALIQLERNRRLVRSLDTQRSELSRLNTELMSTQQQLKHYNRRLEEEVQERTADMRLAFAAIKNTTEGVAVISPNGNIVETNPAFTRITGYAQDQAVNLPWSSLMSNRQGEHFFSRLWKELQTKGQWEGELWSRRNDGTEFLKRCTVDAVRDEQSRITHFVMVFNDITDSYHKDQELIHQALHDPLTGLGNRSLLADRLKQGISLAERNRVQLGLLYIDLDQFKSVNDTLGHHIGDLLLKSVAQRIQFCLRASDTLARVGGDEFVVVLNEIHSAHDCASLALKLINNFHAPFDIQELMLYARGSIGIAVYPEDGQNAATLMKNADIALYAAKDAGRNTYAFFDSKLALLAHQRLEMEQALRESLMAQEFSLVYQPKVDSQNGRLSGLEALMRWRHPNLGETPPNIFIPIAEESGLIDKLGEWAISEVCRQIAQWYREGCGWQSVAINISTRQLLTENLPELFRRQTDHYVIDPHYLEIEVTESFIMENLQQSIPVLQALRTMGIRIAIDDFGTGHASLAYLRELPADLLKIDQYFTRELPTDPVMREIVATIVSMAHTLGLRVIAEGVETRDQVELLREIGCDELQGFLFAHPREPQCVDFSVNDWFS